MIFKKAKKYLKKYWQWAAIVALAIAFFIGTSSFNYITQKDGFIKWASPDETANYIFAKMYAQEDKMTIYEEYNLYVDDIMHPRSFRSDNGWIKPMSFLGIILIYGKIAAATSYKVLPYLTQLFAAVGLVYFYLLIKKIFGRRNAWLSVFLLAAFPPFVYYSARSMFHNVLFTVLLVIGLYYLVLAVLSANGREFKHKWPRIKRWLYAALGGGFIGLAIATRTSELLWVAPMLFILWVFNVRKTGAIKLILIIVFILLAMLPVFYWNQIIYGSYFFGGYTEMNQSIMNIAGAGSDLVKSTAKGEFAFHSDLIKKIKDNIFYFGFHPRQSLLMLYYYFIKMFYWFFFLAFFGLSIFLRQKRKIKRKYWAYLSVWSALSAILVFYYGSWEFHDNPDPDSFTIGNSYTRYWLPVYLGAIPFVSYFIMRLTRAVHALLRRSTSLNKQIFLCCSRAVIIILLSIISIKFVLFNSQESLFPLHLRQIQSREARDRILELTEDNAAIITLYHDKLLFPERKVVVGLFDNVDMVAKYAKLVDKLPVYYFNFTLPEDAIEYLNNRRLGEAGLRIEEVEEITNGFALYRLRKIQ